MTLKSKMSLAMYGTNLLVSSIFFIECHYIHCILVKNDPKVCAITSVFSRIEFRIVFYSFRFQLNSIHLHPYSEFLILISKASHSKVTNFCCIALRTSIFTL